MIRRACFVAALLAAPTAAAHAGDVLDGGLSAGDPCDPVPEEYAVCQTQERFQIENDNELFAVYTPIATDERYTNGWRLSNLYCVHVARPPSLRLSGLQRNCPAPDPVTRLVYAFVGNRKLKRVRAGAVLGQTIYTPVDLRPSAPIVTDRPYAGMAMLGAQLEVVTESDTLHVELVAAWTGPTALGKEFQDIVHHLMDIPQAHGWGNQIRSEGGPQATVRYTRGLWSSQDPLEETGPPRASLGAHGMASAGLIHGRLGGGLAAASAVGSPLAEEDPAIALAFERSNRSTSWWKKVGFGLLARSELRLVGWNSLMEGPYLDGDSVHTVNAAPLVLDVELGFSLRWGPGQLTWINVIRSPEMNDERVDENWHDFRQIQITAFW